MDLNARGLKATTKATSDILIIMNHSNSNIAELQGSIVLLYKIKVSQKMSGCVDYSCEYKTNING